MKMIRSGTATIISTTNMMTSKPMTRRARKGRTSVATSSLKRAEHSHRDGGRLAISRAACCLAVAAALIPVACLAQGGGGGDGMGDLGLGNLGLGDMNLGNLGGGGGGGGNGKCALWPAAN